jgi:hypothetical protein
MSRVHVAVEPSILRRGPISPRVQLTRFESDLMPAARIASRQPAV